MNLVNRGIRIHGYNLMKSRLKKTNIPISTRPNVIRAKYSNRVLESVILGRRDVNNGPMVNLNLRFLLALRKLKREGIRLFFSQKQAEIHSPKRIGSGSQFIIRTRIGESNANATGISKRTTHRHNPGRGVVFA